MLLKRWEPFGDIRYDNAVDRFWRRAFMPSHFRRPMGGYLGQAAVDVYQDEDDLMVRVTMPGVKPEDVDAAIMDNVLTIEAKNGLGDMVEEGAYLHREHRLGRFRRVLSLPRDLDADKAKAAYENGVLTIRIPRAEEAKRKSLKIEVNALEGAKS